ncbi:hypothetical protein [Desmospora profundinema]|uniref:Uncharacterized protein n=1 Tax=Desmospora profundinema TaxID=1571184 RepID=A0ABU1IKY0_9BACL|nr:hypothetical protein [Desmospora profundinema]MDR6225435.1 hypothetical protein [Desmospora profundinema]
MAWTEEEREEIKNELWPRVKDPSLPAREQMEAAMGILEAYWNQSVEFWYDRNWDERHPSYKRYGAGFLAHHAHLFPEAIRAGLIRHFGTNPDLLVPGHIRWAPEGSPERKAMEAELKAENPE